MTLSISIRGKLPFIFDEDKVHVRKKGLFLDAEDGSLFVPWAAIDGIATQDGSRQQLDMFLVTP